MKYTVVSKLTGQPLRHENVPREARHLIPLAEGEKLRNGHLKPKAIRPAVTTSDVKAEAERRITERFPLWRQMNILRDGDAVQAAQMAEVIDTIRADSNRIEALRRIPADFRHDKHWSLPTLATDIITAV